MESQIKKHFLFSVELLARLVSGQTTLNYQRFLSYVTLRKNEKATMSQDELDNEDCAKVSKRNGCASSQIMQSALFE